MIRTIKALTCALALSTLAGCYTLTVNMDPADAPSGPVAGHFHTDLKVHHVIYGLVTVGNPEIQAEIKRLVAQQGGRAARNVRLIHQHSFIDGLLGGITFGIYTPTSVTIEGDVVR